jgi:hypothetical protein
MPGFPGTGSNRNGKFLFQPCAKVWYRTGVIVIALIGNINMSYQYRFGGFSTQRLCFDLLSWGLCAILKPHFRHLI